MDPRQRRVLIEIIIWLSVGALAGLAYVPVVAARPGTEDAWRVAVQGILVTGLVYTVESAIARTSAGERLRRRPFALVFLVKTLLDTMAILVAFGLGTLLLFPTRFDGATPLWSLAEDSAYALAVSILTQEALLIRDLIGGRVLVNVLLGRYHRPRTEHRIFLVLDVDGSTALAERLGGEGVHALLRRLFDDVAAETGRFGGETHAYIGDQVIVTWPLRADPAANARSLRCCLAIRERVQAHAADYRRAHGHVPDFRIGLHAGPVTAGECGGDRRQIVYFGDTINTAARLQEACKSLGCRLAISGDLLERLTVPPGLVPVDRGLVTLRGRKQPIRAFAIEHGLRLAA